MKTLTKIEIVDKIYLFTERHRKSYTTHLKLAPKSTLLQRTIISLLPRPTPSNYPGKLC